MTAPDPRVNRTGHLGVALLVSAPLAAHLLHRGLPERAVVAGVVLVWLAMLPDVDRRLPWIPHRGPTHSLVFAVLVGASFGGGWWALASVPGLRLPSGLPSPAQGFGLGALAVLAHLLADLLTPAGVAVFWPLSDHSVSIGLVRANDPLANLGLVALGVTAVAGAVGLGTGLL